MIADTEPTIIRPTEGRFRCAYCWGDEAVDEDDHEHTPECGDRYEWTDELPRFSAHLSTPVRELPAGVLTNLPWVDDLPDDTLWVDVLIALGVLADRLEDDDGWWPTCPCCGRRGQLIVPLVELAA